MGGLPSYAAEQYWATATLLYCLAGWERCHVAVADVVIAETFGLPVRHLTV
ncbi:hypothetical protein AB0F77_39725 [Streptomyces sp. NPDC026672]|uniref:hypothetical protein n=1 Tax=Actinomycetes TaxID=1760 RepID=UPI00340C2086